jgi:hypothetical protein
MMKNDFEEILSDLLSRWHHYAKTYRLTGEAGADPMFRNAKSSRQWDSIDDVLDTELAGSTLERMDFEIMGDKRGQGGMDEPYRTAICVNARNCYTGRSVWLSPRLPQNPIERAELVTTSRLMLMRKLFAAGIM